MKKHQPITYFEREGRENWPHVLRLVKRAFERRPDLQSCKVVIFTAIGEGPAAAYNLLQPWDAKIIAVTLPPDFSVMRDGQKVSPHVPPKAKQFFDGVKIPVITARLPFQKIEGAAAHNDQMDLIVNAISLFGGSFAQGIQAVLQACDHGLLEVGEKVIVVTGDSAAVVTASTTGKFLTRNEGLAVHEIICKPRNLTIARGTPAIAVEQTKSLFEDDASLRLKAAQPKLQRAQLTIEGKKVIHENEGSKEPQSEDQGNTKLIK
jgi:hypothetical protein